MKTQPSKDSVDRLDCMNSPKEELAWRGIYYITGTIDSDSLLEIHQNILVKHMDPSWVDDIQLIINCVGGLVSESSALIDLLDWVRMDVRTIAMGTCASMGTCLACCGTHGKRVIAPNTSVMIHGSQWGGYGTKAQIAAVSKEMEREHQRDVEFWIRHSKYKTQEEVEKYFLHGHNDEWMNAKEALSHGIFDYIVGQEPKPKGKKKK